MELVQSVRVNQDKRPAEDEDVPGPAKYQRCHKIPGPGRDDGIVSQFLWETRTREVPVTLVYGICLFGATKSNPAGQNIHKFYEQKDVCLIYSSFIIILKLFLRCKDVTLSSF